MDRLSVFDGEIIEEYLDDDPYPSCPDKRPKVQRKSSPQRLGL